jgi:hypothetical protein
MKIPFAFHFLALVLALTILPASAQQPAAPAAEPKRPVGVPVDAKFFNGRWFKLYQEKGGWTNSKAKCARLGGRLAIIPDAATQKFVAALSEGLLVWLGASDDKVEGAWVWLDGTKMTYTAWDKGEPAASPKEDYLSIWKGKWHDALEGEPTTVGFICEWPAK